MALHDFMYSHPLLSFIESWLTITCAHYLNNTDGISVCWFINHRV
ncbi:hypothetical protein QY97_02709 [Bacillus thermotolerans]|nr:hypothetical protein QY97_02709 [Bacillus thermotolerans]